MPRMTLTSVNRIDARLPNHPSLRLGGDTDKPLRGLAEARQPLQIDQYRPAIKLSFTDRRLNASDAIRAAIMCLLVGEERTVVGALTSC